MEQNDLKQKLMETIKQSSEQAFNDGVNSTLASLIPLLKTNIKNIEVILNNNKKILESLESNFEDQSKKVSEKDGE